MNLQTVFPFKPGVVFVFGSNLAGYHRKGAARDARLLYGARSGVGVGLTGDAYAIPTKDARLYVLPLNTIRYHVDNFLHFAKAESQLNFFVTRIGCGYAGYKDEHIAPMFKDAPANCELPEAWLHATN